MYRKRQGLACQDCACTCKRDRKSTRLNSSHSQISYAVFCLKKKKIIIDKTMIHHTIYHCQQHALCIFVSFFFFFNDTATTEIYTLSLHDALPISCFQDSHVDHLWRYLWAL